MKSLIVAALVTCCGPAFGAQAEASASIGIRLEGSFNDVFAGKRVNAGTFTIRSYESNALLDISFTNGFRQVVGTDGRDTFTYMPFTGSNSIQHTNAMAIISNGRFPTNANPIAQCIWLMCTRDTYSAADLPLRWRFLKDYSTNEVFVTLEENQEDPGRIASCDWYVTNFIVLGTNKYRLAFYPDGWLAAKLAISPANSSWPMSAPIHITYTHYQMRTLGKGEIKQNTHFSRDEVLPLENVDCDVTNFSKDKVLTSYVPMIVDSTTRVDDRRIGKIIQVRSGKWWTARELFISGHSP